MEQIKLSQLVLINKPIDWTSFDVVKKVRGLIKKQYKLKKIKVGHAGTLDPKASGLLILCVGEKTKQIQQFENLDKQYIGIMKLGCVTESFDSEKEEINFKSYDHISEQIMLDTFNSFIGTQEQTPPIFSAIKLDGERLYKKARRGEKDIYLKPRKIIINKLEMMEFNLPFIKFKVSCSKGTYIRSLVNDIGAQLTCGAYLYKLQRTKIGKFNLKNAKEIQDIEVAL